MKIAIIGAGMSGLALTYFLSKWAKVDVFDKGNSASYISTGLMYPFQGKFSKKTWMGDLGLEKTKELLKLSESKLNKPVAHYGGILRPAVEGYQKNSFARSSRKNKDTRWVKDCTKFYKDFSFEGLFIPNGVTVYSSLYLQGLKKSCLDNGIKFYDRKITNTKELNEYDQIVIAAGSKTLEFEEGKNLPIDLILGRTLICKWPKKFDILPMSMMSKGHIALSSKEDVCYIGSTYERGKEILEDKDVVMFLKNRVGRFFKNVKELEVLDIVSGIRACRIDSYIPIIKKASKKVWVFTAMGSRGLIYHALLAEILAKAIENGDENLLPNEVRV